MKATPISILLMGAGFLLGPHWGCAAEEEKAPFPAKSSALVPVDKRRPAPDFVLRDLTDTEHALAAYRGKVVFLNFWATWCGPCRVEAPALERLYQRMAGRDFELLAISTDQSTDPIGPFVERYGLSFPVLWDSEQQVARLYEVTGIPVSLLIDRRGQVAARVVGAREWDSPEWQNAVEVLLAEDQNTNDDMRSL